MQASNMAKNECDPKESQEAIKATYSFIVAVDVGTTYTKVAWKPTKTAEQDIYLFIDDQWESQRKVPTAALYRDQSTSLFSRGARELEFVAFGFEAMQQYNEEREKGLALFKKFKMQLHDKKDFGTNIEVKGELKGGKTTAILPAVTVFCDIMVHIKNLILDHIQKAHGKVFSMEDIKWVLTVPALWMASARDVMRQAAKKAEIYKICAPRQLAIALEPESAALHVRSLQARDLLMGSAAKVKKYIVVDIGGGTIDAAVHEIVCHEESRKDLVHEIEGCVGSAYGATAIDKEFETFLCNLKSCGQIFAEVQQSPQVWNALLANFENSKGKFDGKQEMQIEMPGSMFVQYAKKANKILKCLTQKKSPNVHFNPGSDILRVSPATCTPWYEPTISSTIQLIHELHTKHTVEALFVVGGFAKCKVLQQRLEKEFPTLQLVIPEDPGFAIIKGAVQYGPLKAIASRTSYSTYGIACSRRFKDGDDPQKKFFSKKHGADYCRGTFSVFVTMGEKLDPTAPYTETFYPMELDQSNLTIAIYATDVQDPKYITDPGCVMIGSLSFDIDPLSPETTVKDDYRSVTVKMDFSGPEIFVSATDHTGTSREQTIDFLPSSQYCTYIERM